MRFPLCPPQLSAPLSRKAGTAAHWASPGRESCERRSRQVSPRAKATGGLPAPAPHSARTRRTAAGVRGNERHGAAGPGRGMGRDSEKERRVLTILEVAGAIAGSVPAALAGPLVGVVVVIIGVIVRVLVGVVGVISYHDIFPPRSEATKGRQAAGAGAAPVTVGAGAAVGAGGSVGSRHPGGDAPACPGGGGGRLAALPGGSSAATAGGSLVAGLEPVLCAGGSPAAGGGLGLRGGGGGAGGGSPRQRAVVPQQQDGAARCLRRLPAARELVLGAGAEQAVHLPVVLPLDPLPPSGGGRRAVVAGRRRRLLAAGGPQATPVDAHVELGDQKPRRRKMHLLFFWVPMEERNGRTWELGESGGKGRPGERGTSSCPGWRRGCVERPGCALAKVRRAAGISVAATPGQCHRAGCDVGKETQPGGGGGSGFSSP